MNHVTDHIIETLKRARETKGLSQRALGNLAGLPQSHISKIESGAVDLRVSSLIEIARVLDLELALVPRKSVPAVNAIVRSTANERAVDRSNARSGVTELRQLQNQLATAIDRNPLNVELAQIQGQVRDLQRFRLPPAYVDPLREINKTFRALMKRNDLVALKKPLGELQELRNRLAHSNNLAPVSPPRPAYALEDDGHG